MLEIFAGLNCYEIYSSHKILQECYKNCENDELVLQIVQFSEGHHKKYC